MSHEKRQKRDLTPLPVRLLYVPARAGMLSP
jgi:hypothetical protein